MVAVRVERGKGDRLRALVPCLQPSKRASNSFLIRLIHLAKRPLAELVR
jgi:hypothetical protein